MMHGKKVVVVIPALNEEATIGEVVEEAIRHVDNVVVVDDGSSDQTASIACEAGATVVSHSENLGYDRSIEDGFGYAVRNGAAIVITFDADGQHIADDISSILAPIQAGKADIVVGRRPTRSRVSEQFFGLYASYRLGISDPLCGFKAYRTEVYRNIGHFDEHKTIGTQLIFEAQKIGYTIEEVDVSIADRVDNPRFGQQLEANMKILAGLCRLIIFDLITRHSPN